MKYETVKKENGVIPGIGCSLRLVLNALVEERGHVKASGLFYQQLSPYYEQATESEQFEDCRQFATYKTI